MPSPEQNNPSLAPDAVSDAPSLADAQIPSTLGPEGGQRSSSPTLAPQASEGLRAVSQLWPDKFRDTGWNEFVANVVGGRAEFAGFQQGLRVATHAAVLTIDIVDSTGFLEEVERKGQSPGEALEAVFAPLAASIKMRGAHFANIIGDGLSAIFTREPAAWDALNTALELQEHWKRERIGGVLAPELRVGLAYGKVELQSLGDDGQARVVGSVVNKAFHAASGKARSEKLPDIASGFSIYIDKSFRNEVNLPGLMAKAA